MKILIIGDGKVGYSLAENLSKEDNDVTIIDKNAEALKKAEENLDVMCIKGNGISVNTLLEAGVDDTDLLIAVTASDELNMVCCLTGKKLGAARTIARIRDHEYASELALLKERIGLDMVINPEQAAADEIARIFRYPSAISVDSFSRRKVDMVEVKVTKDTPVAGLKLKELPPKIAGSILICAVVRNDEVFIPNGDFRIENDDIICIIGKPSNVYAFYKYLGKCTQKIKNVMMVGGGRIAYYLANLLKEMDIRVKVIESDRERCEELSELLPDTLIIHGDGTEEDLLKSENIGEMGGFIAITGRDEDNLMSSLLAKQYGVQTVVTKITRMNYSSILKTLHLDNIVSPKHITADIILRYVRSLKNARGSKIESLHRIINGQAEIVEFIANDSTSYLNIPLKDIKFARDTLIAVIVRKNEIIIPHGNDVIKKDDRVIIVTKNKAVLDLNQLASTGGLQNELQNSLKNIGHTPVV